MQPDGKPAATAAEEVRDEVPGIVDLLQEAIAQGASDLHLTTESPPLVRLSGELARLPYRNLDAATVKQLMYSIMSEEQQRRFEAHLELDFSFGLSDLGRCRANVFKQRSGVAGALRIVPRHIPGFDELGLPVVVQELCTRPRGLILVTGPTGSGKSTSLAAMIDLINETQRRHIITIEDPIEFLHPHKNCIVNQRELHADTLALPNALRAALREDPDIVLIGELRDRESTELALSLAETGHLTLGTLHTNSAVSSINRIIDIFPAAQQRQIRAQLSFVLEAVMSQSLLPAVSGGRVLCAEVMIPNAAIRNLMREGKSHQIPALMQSGQAEHGMQTFNQGLARLVRRGKIAGETALAASSDPKELIPMIQRAVAAAGSRRPPRRALAVGRKR